MKKSHEHRRRFHLVHDQFAYSSGSDGRGWKRRRRRRCCQGEKKLVRMVKQNASDAAESKYGTSRVGGRGMIRTQPPSPHTTSPLSCKMSGDGGPQPRHHDEDDDADFFPSTFLVIFVTNESVTKQEVIKVEGEVWAGSLGNNGE